MDMSQLETEYQSEAEAGDTDQGVTYNVNHQSGSPGYVSLPSSSMMGMTDPASMHFRATAMKRFL